MPRTSCKKPRRWHATDPQHSKLVPRSLPLLPFPNITHDLIPIKNAFTRKYSTKHFKTITYLKSLWKNTQGRVRFEFIQRLRFWLLWDQFDISEHARWEITVVYFLLKNYLLAKGFFTKTLKQVFIKKGGNLIPSWRTLWFQRFNY